MNIFPVTVILSQEDYTIPSLLISATGNINTTTSGDGSYSKVQIPSKLFNTSC